MAAKPEVIGFIGAAGVGKTTLAKMLVANKRFSRVSFGAGIKAMVEGFLGHAAPHMPLALREGIVVHDLKDHKLPILNGVSSRDLQIAVGQGVRAMAPDFWCQQFIKDAAAQIAVGMNVICDDIRQANEIATIHALGGVVVKLNGARAMGESISDLDFDDLIHDFTLDLTPRTASMVDTTQRDMRNLFLLLGDR